VRKLRDIGFAPPKVDFVACDYPFADKMQIQLLAVFAERNAT